MKKYDLKDYFNEEEEFNKEWQEKRAGYDYSKNPTAFRIIRNLKPKKKVLSLGCGIGREVKFLVEKGDKVVGVDIAEKVIESSKKVEPKAEYHCMPAEDYLDNRKYDYIIALSSVLNYMIIKKKRIQLAENLKKMLKDGGEIILGLNLINFKKDLFKLIFAPLIAFLLKEEKDYDFGDIYYRKRDDKGRKRYFVKTHIYSKREIKNLFKNMKISFIQPIGDEVDKNYEVRISFR